MPPSRTSAAGLAARERSLKALELRKQGRTFTEIAAELGYARRGGAHRAVMDALRRLETEPAEDVLRLELLRLDAMQMALRGQIQAGDNASIRTALRIMDRRAKYLGLDRNETREADAVEAIAISYASQVTWLQAALTEILQRLDLSPEQQAAAPVVIAGYLDEDARGV